MRRGVSAAGGRGDRTGRSTGLAVDSAKRHTPNGLVAWPLRRHGPTPPQTHHTLFFPKESLLLLGFAAAVTACSKDDDGDASTSARGRLRVEITDAPLEDADVSGVFVTVAEVRVNGEATAAFSEATTIELSAYSGGETFELARDIEVDAEAGARVELVLDVESDAAGTGPGAYVLRADGTKDPLAFGTADRVVIGAAAAFEAEADAETRVVADVDLRKAVERVEREDGASDYTFVSEARLRASARVVDAGATGEIHGEAATSYERPEGERLVVYAYPSGAYDHDAAVESDFAEATSSARVGADGAFSIAFLPVGDYELVTASYVPAEGAGEAQLRGTVAVDALLAVDTEAVSVSTEAAAAVSLDLTGLML